LASSEILPNYVEINPFDATKYIDSGRQLVDGGELREISRAPTVALIYAAIYLFVQKSMDWFVLSAGITNILLFTLVWFSTLYFGLRFKKYVHPYIVVGIIFLSPAFVIILGNPSDALYAAVSAIALAKTIDFYRSRDVRDVAWASLFVGLAFATRLDGLYLSPLFIVITLVLGFRKVALGKLIAAIVVPGLLIIGAFILVSGLTTGNFSTDYGGIAYASLAWYSSPDDSGVIIGGNEVIQEFGTEEENRGSAILAFTRNPNAVLQQIIGNLKQVPNQILSDYGGKRFAPYLILLIFAGVYALLKKKSYAILIIMFLWPLSVGLYLPYYTRSGYYLLYLYIPIVLSSIGLAFTLAKQRTKKERIGILCVLTLFSLYSLVDGKPAFLAVGLITISIFAFNWLSHTYYPNRVESDLAGLFLAITIGVILRPVFTFPPAWNIGSSPQEKSVHFLQERLKRGDVVATYVPMPVVAARMNETFLWNIQLGDDRGTSLREWIEIHEVKALIIEPDFIRAYPEVWEAVEMNVGGLLEREFLADPGSVQIFVVQD